MSVVFVTNPGAASKKYALYMGGRMMLSAVYEKTANEFVVTNKIPGQRENRTTVTETEYSLAISHFKEVCRPILESAGATIDAVGVRVVAAGSRFQTHQKIDDVYLSLLREKEPTAPLHIPIVLSEARECRALFPGLPVVAVSDTAAFKHLPDLDRTYSIAPEEAKGYDLYRYGYHGLSVSSVIDRAHAVFGIDPERIIVCHLGSGMSVTGVKNGKVVSTSAGYTSLTGVPMLSRGGDIDSGVTLELLRLEHGNHKKVHERLHYRSGLQALSASGDLRKVLHQKSQGDKTASFALDFLAYQIQKAIASATIATGGVDALIFTGTIGQRSPDFRLLVADGLSHLGIGIDSEKNDVFLGREGVISHARALVKSGVVCTDEMAEIAQTTLRVLETGV